MNEYSALDLMEPTMEILEARGRGSVGGNREGFLVEVESEVDSEVEWERGGLRQQP